MLEDLTVIIPTHNRKRYLSRVLEYYAQFHLNIVVCDSSDERYPDAEKYPIKYYYMKDGFFEKLWHMVSLTRTKYILICADDDFIIPSAIRTCMDFLGNHPDYSSVQGHYIGYEKRDSSYTPMYPTAVNRDINLAEGAPRLTQYFISYLQLFYCVHRRENLVQAFSYFYENKTVLKEPNLIEVLVGVITILNGKHKVLPIFYSVREILPNSGGRRCREVDDIARSEEHKTEYATFLEICARHLCTPEKTTFEASYENVRQALNVYIQGDLLRKRSGLKKAGRNCFKCMYPSVEQRWTAFVSRKFMLPVIMKSKGFPFNNHSDRAEFDRVDRLIKKHQG